MAKSSKIVLSPEDIAGVQQSQRELTDLLTELDRAEECGVDCQQFRAATKEALEQAGKIVMHYGSGVPKRR
jgi:hypothetical protein